MEEFIYRMGLATRLLTIKSVGVYVQNHVDNAYKIVSKTMGAEHWLAIIMRVQRWSKRKKMLNMT